MNEGVVVKTVINTMVFDGSTTDPIQKAVRDAMIAFMAATAQAQAEATKAAQKAASPMRSRSPRRNTGAGSHLHPRAVRHRSHDARPASGRQRHCEGDRSQQADDLSDRTGSAAAEAVLATWGQ